MLAVVVVLLASLASGWRLAGPRRRAELSTEFDSERPRLEREFLASARASGKPRGLRWGGCEFGAAEFARDRDGRTVALVAVTVSFEAVPGSDMEGLPAVGLPRQATAAFVREWGRWRVAGPALFNHDPAGLLGKEGSGYVRLPDQADAPVTRAGWSSPDGLFVALVWAAMTAAGFAHVVQYGHNCPLTDEWEFIPALTNNEPLVPWLWKQHNEHRLPLPRLLYWTLFQITGDFRAGMVAIVAGLSVLALALCEAARRSRGAVLFADAFFPLALLHWGHHENLRMGYQINFVSTLALVCGLLWCVLRPGRPAPILAGVLGLLVMTTGASGLPFGLALVPWLLWAAWRERGSRRRAVALVVLAVLPMIYTAVYFTNYERPGHHPPSAGLVPSLVIAAQFVSNAWGAVADTWPGVGYLTVGVLVAVCGAAARVLVERPGERFGVVGMACVLAGLAGLALGIGWGRSGFGVEKMGFASRYGLLALPALVVPYLAAARYAPRWAAAGQVLALVAVLALLSSNTMTGRDQNAVWAEYQAGMARFIAEGQTVEQALDSYFGATEDVHKQRARVGLPMLRDAGLEPWRRLPGRTNADPG